METQSKAILAHLQQGNTITGIEALNEFGCFRLPSRIYDLKKLGHKIDKETITLPNDKRIARYKLNITNSQ
ncbi:MAG TPA: helix-turn-helix domain-containing protein [Nitrososphaeraceae archaeon]